jgi:hypothetical protein
MTRPASSPVGGRSHGTEVPRKPLVEALRRETDLRSTNDVKAGHLAVEVEVDLSPRTS